MRKQLLLIFIFFILNIVLSKKIPRADGDNGDNNVANVNDGTGQVETEKEETGVVETGQGEAGQNETGQGETGKTETSQGSTEQDTTKQENTTNQDSTQQDSTQQNSNHQDSSDNNNNNNNNNNNSNINNETVKSNVTTTYGSVEIEYIPTPPKDKTTVNLIIYFSSLFGILVLFCIVHSIVYFRPRVIAKRNEKKKAKQAQKVQNQMEMVANNKAESEANSYGLEELQEAKLKDNKSSPEASIDFTSYQASSTDCIINLDNNSSNNLSFNRRKSSGSKKSYKKK